MILRRGAIAVPVLVCLVGSLAAAGPASAERASVPDRLGDSSGWGDIERVDVDHGARQLRVVIHQPPNDARSDQYEVYVDTTPRRPGPDFVLYDYHGVWGHKEVIYRVDRWRDEDWGAKVRCAGAEMDRGRDADDQHQTMDFAVPRHCLGSPRVLRIQAIAAQEHMVNDYAPGERRPTRWLRAG